MNIRYPLTATVRELTGHKTRNVRKSGNIPATVYGNTITAMTVSIPVETFITVYKQAGETHIVDLTVDGKTHPVLIKNVQTHPVSNKTLHVEFMTVNLKETLKTHVPVQVIGESPAVSEGKGVLLSTLQEIEIETLPTNIPETLTIDISSLTEVDHELKVKDLSIPSGVTVVTDAELTIVKIGAIVVEEAPAPAAENAPEGEAAPAAQAESSSAEETPKTE